LETLTASFSSIDLRRLCHVTIEKNEHNSSKRVGPWNHESLKSPPACAGGMKGTVVVTGGSRGLGYALSRQLVLHHDVARVVLVSRNAEELQKACARLRRESLAEIYAFRADVTDPVQVARCADAAETEGPIRAWINNAGYAGGYELVRDRSPEGIRHVIDATLTSTALGCREAVRRRVPVVVNVAGGGSSGEACPTFAVYGACKRGLVGLTESLALEEPETCFGLVWPGMFRSRLLLDGMGQPARFVFERLAADPNTVAADIAPQIASLTKNPRPGAVRHLTRFVPTLRRAVSSILPPNKKAS
jgi:NAD(P)-dependent dehydrogenase (short-subunit alcohol dehydrogenase family)